MNQLAVTLGSNLSELQASVATAESCTGGGIAFAITSVPGSSGWFAGGFIPYSNHQKMIQLDVPEQTLRTHGAVSQATVSAMARGACLKTKARFSVAVSGVAGPVGGNPENPVGTVWIAMCDGETIYTVREVFTGSREEIRARTIESALQGLIELTCGSLNYDKK